MIKRIVILALGVSMIVAIMIWDWICWQFKRMVL
mgnify:CR=1 FL=1